MWKQVAALKPPFNDAVNYRSRAEKEFFNKLFLKTEELEKIASPAIFFIIGEKGSGKTAYATYMENNAVKESKCKLVTMTETQYKRFIELKNKGQLAYSDYANIWRSMLLYVVSQMVIEKSKGVLDTITGKFKKVEQAVGLWSKNALNPEVESAFEALTSDALKVSLNGAIGEIGGEQKREEIKKVTVLQHHLLSTESSLKAAIQELKLSNQHILFIDGIDYRPEHVPYTDYLECVKGLGEAVWQLNTEFFQNVRDTQGRIKIVLLVRPDVFHCLNLHNSNSRIQDNAVFLSWHTTDKEYAQSRLYEACGKFLSSQQSSPCNPDDAWKHYFQPMESAGEHFKRMLKTSFQKPRDLLTFLKLLIELQKDKQAGNLDYFQSNLLSNPRFSRDSADYLLGEIRNYSSFYMPPGDFGSYLKFFQYLNGKLTFSIEDFTTAYGEFKGWARGENIKAKEYLRDADTLLQYFYDVNLIGYKERASDESETFLHWSFRERSLNNLAPKVKNAAVLMINPGVAKALDIGKAVNANGISAANSGRPMPRQKPPRAFGRRRPR